MHLSRFNYVSDCERDGQRVLMNFLSQSCDIVDEESALYFSEKKGTLSKDEKEYAAERGYLFESEDEEVTVLKELYERELQSVKAISVVHLDTFDGKEDFKGLEKIRSHSKRSLVLYSENLLDTPVLHHFSDCAPDTIVTISENLGSFEPLLLKGVISQVAVILPLAGSGSVPVEEDTESLLDTLVEHGTAVEIIARVEKKDVKKVKSLMNYFIYKGWPFLENFTCSLEPENNEGCIFGYWYTGVDLAEAVYQEYAAHPQTEFCSMEKWVGINPVHALIWTGKLPRPSFHFCEASKGLTVFTGDGEQLPCLNLAKTSEEEFQKRNAHCKECMYALSCGGGCKLKSKENGCPPVKELIEVSLEHYFDEFLERLNFYEQYYGGIQ